MRIKTDSEVMAKAKDGYHTAKKNNIGHWVLFNKQGTPVRFIGKDNNEAYYNMVALFQNKY